MKIVVDEIPKSANECLFCRDNGETYWVGENIPMHNPLYKCTLNGDLCCEPDEKNKCTLLITFKETINK